MQVLTVILLLAFLWSITLYLLAVFGADRRQEAGLGYSVVGFVLFVVLYLDRIPLSDASNRAFLSALPGVSNDAATAGSPVWPAVVIAALYLVRVMVYYELLVPKDATEPAEQVGPQLRPRNSVETEEIFVRANDLVAPPLSFATLAVALTGTLGLCYRLPWWGLLITALVLLSGYYAAALYTQLWALIQSLGKILQLAGVFLWASTRRAFLLLVLVIARGEVIRRGGREDAVPLYSWAAQKIAHLDQSLNERRRTIGDQLRAIFASGQDEDA